MTDFSKMTVDALRELARKVLGPGHSRLKTKAEMVRALEEAASSAATAPARAARRVRAAATRAADATEKAVRAVTEAVGKTARSAKRTAGEGKAAAEEAGKAGAKAAARIGKAAARTAEEAGKVARAAAKAAEPRKRAGAKAAKPGKAPAAAKAKAARAGTTARKVGKVAEAVAAVAGAVVSPRTRKRPAPAKRTGPDPDGFFVARVRGEDAVREAPHPLVEPAPEGEEEEEIPSSVPDERLGELPWGYGDDAFVALPRDPRTLFLYWDWSPDTRARAFEGLDHPRAQLWIFARAGEGWDRLRTVEFALESRGYYVHDLQPGRTYRAEIHAVDRHGRERILSHGSNEVALPAVGPSPLVDDRFVRIPWELPLGRLLGPGHAGAPFSEEARSLLARLSDWSRFAGREAWGSSAGGMGGRPSSPTAAPSSPSGPFPPRER